MSNGCPGGFRATQERNAWVRAEDRFSERYDVRASYGDCNRGHRLLENLRHVAGEVNHQGESTPTTE
jgi:hypothetical protein